VTHGASMRRGRTLAGLVRGGETDATTALGKRKPLPEKKSRSALGLGRSRVGGNTIAVPPPSLLNSQETGAFLNLKEVVSTGAGR